MSAVPQAVLRHVADLSSETRIHFIVFCAVVALVTAYVIGAPAYVLFVSEARFGAVPFLFAGVVVFAAAVAVRRRIAVRGIEPFPRSARAAAFRDLYARTVEGVGMSGEPPPLLWVYTDQRTHAQTVRWGGAPAIVVSAGLVQHARAAPADARAYLVHELAHVANGDLPVFEWTLGLTAGFRLVAVLAVVAAASLVVVPASADAPSILFFDAPESPIFVFLLLMVGTLWLFTILFAWLLVVRYAGVLTSLRELHADTRAAAWMPPGAYVATIRDARAQPGRSRLRSLLSPRLIHLSASERIALLEDPARLVAPKIRYFALVGALVLFLQSSPFTTGVDANVMRIAPLALWAVLAVAYLLNLHRVQGALSAVPVLRTPAHVFRLALTTGVLLTLPTLRTPQLYPSIVTMFSGRAATLAVLQDEWSQWKLAWAGTAIVLFVTGVAATIVLTTRLRLPAGGIPERRGIAAACAASALEVLIIGCSLYTSSVDTWIDPLANLVSDHRMWLATLPSVAFVLLLLAPRATRDPH